jgi:glyceraldehyde 3-phosphate dehydrogenase
MPIKVAINGFGRTGRMFFRAALQHKELELVGINDLTDPAALARLLKHDSVHGTLRYEVKADGDALIVAGRVLHVLKEPDPQKLPWRTLGVDLVVDCSGKFKRRDKAALHLSAGAHKVLISAPGEGADVTICMGVNQTDYDPRRHQVISNASCTTNCLAPVAKVLDQSFGIVNGFMTTVHAYTNDQTLLDGPHKDPRRARAAAMSMVPTSTGAAKAIGLVLPRLKGKLDGIAVRVPTPNVSMVDLTANLERDTDAEAIKAAMKRAAEGELKGILEYCEEPLVSSDFNGNPHSSIFDAALTSVLGGRMAKVFAWYDNEYGYACRLADAAVLVAGQR